MAETLPRPKMTSNLNFEWITRHTDDLTSNYPNCWIAVDKQQVLAADPDLGEVHRMSDAAGATDGVVYHFVDDGSTVYFRP